MQQPQQQVLWTWIPVVLMPLPSSAKDHHQQLGSLNALLLQQHSPLLEPIEPPNTNQVFSQFLVFFS
ncbi:hypothetical protein AAF134_09085 [Synechococcus lacustris Tous-12m]